MMWWRPAPTESLVAMLPLPKALLAAASVTAIALTAAPAAHATWMTGTGPLPLFRSEAVCGSGMDFQYATLSTARITLPDGKWVAAPVLIRDLGVWVVSPSGVRDPVPLVVPS